MGISKLFEAGGVVMCALLDAQCCDHSDYRAYNLWVRINKRQYQSYERC